MNMHQTSMPTILLGSTVPASIPTDKAHSAEKDILSEMDMPFRTLLKEASDIPLSMKEFAGYTLQLSEQYGENLPPTKSEEVLVNLEQMEGENLVAYLMLNAGQTPKHSSMELTLYGLNSMEGDYAESGLLQDINETDVSDIRTINEINSAEEISGVDSGLDVPKEFALGRIDLSLADLKSSEDLEFGNVVEEIDPLLVKETKQALDAIQITSDILPLDELGQQNPTIQFDLNNLTEKHPGEEINLSPLSTTLNKMDTEENRIKLAAMNTVTGSTITSNIKNSLTSKAAIDISEDVLSEVEGENNPKSNLSSTSNSGSTSNPSSTNNFISTEQSNFLTKNSSETGLTNSSVEFKEAQDFQQKPLNSMAELSALRSQDKGTMTSTLIPVGEEISKAIKLGSSGNELSDRIFIMAKGNLQHAVIRLDPPELGALEIRIQMVQDQAQIQIISPSSQVREALEQQADRLRETLLEQGLDLSSFDVKDQNSNDGQGDNGSDDEDNEGNVIAHDEQNVSKTNTSLGFVDQYV